MSEETGGVGKSISFIAETISKTAADVAGTVWNHLTQTNFTIDIDQAPKIIAGLEDSIKKLRVLYEKADRLVTMKTPGKDPYSGFAVLAIRQSAGDEEGGYRWANLEAQQALQKTIENIKRAVETYHKTDQAAGDALKPQG
ncbi:hypothetical protein [Lentzea sp. NPDC004782]|uniref:hypothetical protein n=1 Tax=Lentzea sp. NPDC004782 TaxID=3154458 RepID=UPI0033A4DC3A